MVRKGYKAVSVKEDLFSKLAKTALALKISIPKLIDVMHTCYEQERMKVLSEAKVKVKGVPVPTHPNCIGCTSKHPHSCRIRNYYLKVRNQECPLIEHEKFGDI